MSIHLYEWECTSEIFICATLMSRAKNRSWVYPKADCQTLTCIKIGWGGCLYMQLEWQLINFPPRTNLISVLHRYLRWKNWLLILGSYRDIKLCPRGNRTSVFNLEAQVRFQYCCISYKQIGGNVQKTRQSRLQRNRHHILFQDKLSCSCPIIENSQNRYVHTLPIQSEFSEQLNTLMSF